LIHPANASVTIFEDGFEAGVDAWSISDQEPACGQDFWGPSSLKQLSGNRSLWCAQQGTNCQSGQLNEEVGRYDFGEHAIAVAGGANGFDLTNATGATLTLFSFSVFGLGDDDAYFSYAVSLDRVTWYGPRITESDPKWSYQSLDLAEVPGYGSMLGQPRVWIGLIFHSGTSSGTPDEGVFVDSLAFNVAYRFTPTPGPTATPTPSAPMLEVVLLLNRQLYTAGDPFRLTCVTRNQGEGHHQADLYILLDVYGSFWFYQCSDSTWVENLTGCLWSFWPKARQVETILDFIWPVTDAAAAGIKFWSALTPPNSLSTLYSTDVVEFGFTAAATPTPTPSPTPPLYTPTPLPSGVPSPTPLPVIVDFVIRGNAEIYDTGLVVETGELLIIDATGWVCFHKGDCEGTRVGPTGFPNVCYDLECQSQPCNPGFHHAALVGRIENGAYFLIGEQFESRAANRGTLRLFINDGEVSDNDGQFEGSIFLPER